MGLEVKLFRFSLPDVEDVLYLYSLRSDEPYLRKMFVDQDSGGLGYERYVRLYTEGRIERITSLDQVPTGKSDAVPLYANGDRDVYPYHSWELEDNAFELTIQQFFDLPACYL